MLHVDREELDKQKSLAYKQEFVTQQVHQVANAELTSFPFDLKHDFTSTIIAVLQPVSFFLPRQQGTRNR
jgi:hypothetical protein